MKRIVLLSDGTGNSSSTLFKTNVWRMYQSVDLETAPGGVRQIACYNDGVGTSAFKPVAVLGGAFGYGLKRNILSLYEFLCQNWEAGDEIYIFGFSRGAFTARLLASLIAHMGILADPHLGTLRSQTRRIYREFRFARYLVIDMPRIVRLYRGTRKALAWLWRLGRAAAPLKVHRSKIAFLGVWDTVAAYGTPLAELTRGIDRYVFPLTMPDRRLNEHIRLARHALALDDERDSFHPLLWDEVCPAETDRLKQVWFAGMHADIGGGYPDDSMSFHALDWMMDEAGAAGLQYLPHARERFAPPSSQSAVLHDSRKGLSGYYRYQPRRLSAYLLPDDPETAVMRDPAPKARAHVQRIQVHHSALERIHRSADRYAPIVLPKEFDVVGPTGGVTPAETATGAAARMRGQQSVWDTVWHKRVNYFLMVALSVVFALLPALLPLLSKVFTLVPWLSALFPLWSAGPEAGACEWFGCVISPVIAGVGAFLPAFLQPWIETMESHPGTTIGFVAVMAMLLWRSAALQRTIRDKMWPLWAPLRGCPEPIVAASESWVHRLRTSPTYLGSCAWVKWKGLPRGLGKLALLVVVFGLLGIVAITVLRCKIDGFETDGRFCALGRQPPSDDFGTDMMCWPGLGKVKAGRIYRIQLTIKEPWLDRTLPAGPHGVESSRYPLWKRYFAAPLLRTISGRWFQPFVTIVSDDGGRHVQPLDFQNEGAAYVAQFVPSTSGRGLLWVNDVVFGTRGFTSAFYDNNQGTASVGILEQTERPTR